MKTVYSSIKIRPSFQTKEKKPITVKSDQFNMNKIFKW